MIASEKILIYKKYYRGIGYYAKVVSSKDKLILTDFDWSQINHLIQILELSKKILTSQEFNIQMDMRVLEFIDSEETLDWLTTSKNEKPRWVDLRFTESKPSFKLPNQESDNTKLMRIKLTKNYIAYFVDINVDNHKLESISLA